MTKYFKTHPLISFMLIVVITLLANTFIEAKETVNGLILANTFLTTQLIARQALIRLRNLLVMKALVYGDYSDTFQNQGDTIRVRKPTTYTAQDFSTEISLQDITEDSVSVTLNHLADVSVSFSSKERALNIEDFNTLYLNAAMEAIAQKIDEDLHKEFYKAVPYYVGTSGTTPDDLTDFANPAKMLNDNRAPLMGRSAVWNTSAQAKFSVLDAIVSAEKSGSTDALREGSIGRIMGLENYMSQNVQTHTAGTFSAVSAPKVNTLAVVGAYTIVLKGGSGTETIKAGDLFTITTGGKVYYYTAASDATAESGVVSVTTTTPVGAAHAVNTAVTFPDKTAGGHAANLAFHKNACAFVSRPLVPPAGAESYITSFEGIAIRVTAGYNITTKKEILSIDTLYGIKVVHPELAVRILG